MYKRQLSFCVAAVLIGGVKRIASVSQIIVPFMAVIYFVFAVILICCNITKVPAAFATIVTAAFSPKAITGGAVGSMLIAMQKGVARGIFSNEAGLGTASIAHAGAEVNDPVQQGLFGVFEVFVDTIIICTMTGLTIIVSGQWLGELNGAELTQAAFATTYGAFAPFLLTISLTLFAFTTIIGWNYYGERCWEYLFGTKTIPVYRVCYIAVLASAVFLKLEAIWALADIVNGLMAIPNLIALLGLSGVIVSETKKYFGHLEIRDARLAAYKERRIGKKAEV